MSALGVDQVIALDCVEQVRELASLYRVEEVVYDPWRFGQAAQELERERMRTVAFRSRTRA